jgi:hypothetical protein
LTLSEAGNIFEPIGGTKLSSCISDSINKNGSLRGKHPETPLPLFPTSDPEAPSDSLLHTEALSTKFTIDLKEFRCKVEDYEHNLFDIGLRDPLNPVVVLSGEVTGLKPVAVSDDPIEPRLFVISRNAEAVEVLSNQEVSEYERAVTICPDAYRTICGVASQPSDLGVGKQHTYYFQQCLSKIRDVYGPRLWQERDPPATLCTLQCLNPPTRSPAAGAGIMEYLSLIERMPLVSIYIYIYIYIYICTHV